MVVGFHSLPKEVAMPMRSRKYSLFQTRLSPLSRQKIDTNESRHVISNNVVLEQVVTQASLCSLLLNLETQNDVRSVA